jgi:hypothetical protein
MILADPQPHAASPVAGPASRIFVALLFSSTLVIGSFALQAGYGFNIGDEGFFWYGVQRVQAGEVPILDFLSYDPGRYYWSAALLTLLQHNEMMVLRGTAAVFQLLGLFVGVLLLTRENKKLDATLLALGSITLLAWSWSWFKVFDTASSILLVGILTFLIQQPSYRRFFFAGAGVGLIAVFGRNHGVYGVAGILGVLIYLACRRRNIRDLIPGLACFVCGLVVGYLPVLVMLVAIPGFAAAFWESILAIFDRGTNLPLPVPWPWLVPVTKLPLATAAADVLTGVVFIAMIVFGIWSLLWIIRRALQQKPVAPELVASSILMLPYAHYAFSRADVGHLTLGIFPLLIGIFALLNDLPRQVRWILAFTVTIASLIITLPYHPGWNCRIIEQCVATELGGNTLKIEPLISKFVTMLHSVTAQYAPNGRNILVTPLWPGAYALLNRKSPMWDIYALFPRGDEFQRREIEQIKKADPGFVLVLDIPIDGRDDLRFRSIHPRTEQYIRDNFDPLTIGGWSSQVFQFYKGR